MTPGDDTPHVGAAGTRAHLSPHTGTVVQSIGPLTIRQSFDSLAQVLSKCSFLLRVQGAVHALIEVELLHVCRVLALREVSNLSLESLDGLRVSLLQLFVFHVQVSIALLQLVDVLRLCDQLPIIELHVLDQ